MNYSYDNERNLFRVYSNGYKLEQVHNSYNMKKFTCEEDGVEWAKRYFYGGEGEYLSIDVVIEDNLLKIKNWEDSKFKSYPIKVYHIMNGEYDWVVKGAEIKNGILNVSELEDGVYYYDIEIKPSLTLLKWDKVKFEKKGEVINRL